MAKIIDGKLQATLVRALIGHEVTKLKEEHFTHPGLAVILVGDDPASAVYVRNKEKAAAEAGIASFIHMLPAETTQEELLTLIDTLNLSFEVHGILVQLPLPEHINADIVINRIRSTKDVDGFHPVNTGLLHKGLNHMCMLPCTPYGCIQLIKTVTQDLTGMNAVVIGRSHIVGRPVAELLLQENCTVTVAHSHTKGLKELCLKADILIAAVGKPLFVKKDWIKKRAIVIDVGINRIEDKDGKTKLVGDVDYDAVKEVAGAITPVPGGVGPMTVAALLRNTVTAAYLNHGNIAEIPQLHKKV